MINQSGVRELANGMVAIFPEIIEFAQVRQECLRKAVGCASLLIHNDGHTTKTDMVHNGPSREGHVCSNEVGNCGCSHAEPRLVQEILKRGGVQGTLILVCTYSPCTNCANIVIDSGLFSGCVYDILTEHDKRGAEFLKEAMLVNTRQELITAIETEDWKFIRDLFKRWQTISPRS